ncbi:hypothetical protein ACFVYR_15630 [Streptomyces sp. NPDC058284]
MACIEHAEETVKELRAALTQAEITLPSLGIGTAARLAAAPRRPV